MQEFFPEVSLPTKLNTLRPRQDGRRFADDTFKRIFLNENVRNSIKISLEFVPKGPINNIPALVQIMAWHRSGDKPLSEPMMVSLPTHIWVTRPQWVNHLNQNCFANQKLQLFNKAMKPRANSVHYITMVPLTDSMPWVFPWDVFPPDSLIEQRKCQITIIETVLSARGCNYSEKQWNPKPFLCIPS